MWQDGGTYENVVRIYEIIGPYLGTIKTKQFQDALEEYRNYQLTTPGTKLTKLFV